MLLIDAADAVVSVLNATAWGQPAAMKFTAERKWLPVFKLAESDQKVKVIVAPVTDTPELESRASTGHEIRVDIGVMRKLAKANDNTEIDALAELADGIAARFRPSHATGRLRFGAGDRFTCSDAVHEPVAARQHLEQLQQFTSLIKLTLYASGT